MKNKKIYSFRMLEQVENELPERVKEAMSICGWNAFGIYELVDGLLKKEKQENKKSPNHCGKRL